ncbi:MAG: 3'(2'),5'-bisphosphate nucleotidase CysQ [Pseudolabrys sp.]|nr:3'(2'),5'-bisphosphate nucleotidase CysQ [Pseudolabrys sp.]
MKGDDEITAAAASRIIEGLTGIVARAAAATLSTPFSDVATRIKTDLTPITAADDSSEAVILEGLSKLLPDVPVVSEESVLRSFASPLPRSFLIVDPLDGTREFLAGRDEFTVNVAIISDGSPVVGIIAAPAQGMLWRGVVGQGAERLKLRLSGSEAKAEKPVAIQTRKATERLTVVTSRSHLDEHTEDFVARLPVVKRYLCGSAVKFCQLAQGDADVYPRLSPTCEWDIAAGQAIVTAAGGVVASAHGDALIFGGWNKKFRVSDFLAWGDPKAAAAFI